MAHEPSQYDKVSEIVRKNYSLNPLPRKNWPWCYVNFIYQNFKWYLSYPLTSDEEQPLPRISKRGIPEIQLVGQTRTTLRSQIHKNFLYGLLVIIQLKRIKPFRVLYEDLTIWMRLYKATSMLEKSLAQDDTYTDAVCLLAEIMGKKQEYDKAIAL